MSDQDSSVLLESNPEFQKLSDEAKSIVRNKFHSGFVNLSPEAQAIVKQKLGTSQAPSVSQFRKNAAADVNPAIEALNSTNPVMTGINAASQAAQLAQNPDALKQLPGQVVTGIWQGVKDTAGQAADALPYMADPISATYGAVKNTAQALYKKPFSTVVNAAGAAAGGEGIGRASEAMAPRVGSLAKRIGAEVKDVALGPNVSEARAMSQQALESFQPTATTKAEQLGEKYVADARAKVLELRNQLAEQRSRVVPGQGPAEMKAAQLARERVGPLQTKLKQAEQEYQQLLSAQAERAKGLATDKASAGAAMGQAEEAGGFAFKSAPQYEEAIKDRQAMAQHAQFMEGLTPEQAAKTPIEQLQLWRKLSAGARSNGTISKLGQASLSKGEKVIGDELANRSPSFKDARTRWAQVNDALKALPQETAKKRAALRNQLTEIKAQLAKEQEDAKFSLKAVRNTERQGLVSEQKAKVSELTKRTNFASADVQKAQADARELLRQAKAADETQLGEIKKKGEELVMQALARARKRRMLAIGAGAAVAGRFGAWLGRATTPP
jgi:hypothetical protein